MTAFTGCLYPFANVRLGSQEHSKRKLKRSFYLEHCFVIVIMSYNYGGSKKNIVNLEKQNIGFYDHRLVNIVHSYSISIILCGQPVAAESIQILSR